LGYDSFYLKELVLDINLMYWLVVAILVLEILSMFSIICGFLLFVLIKTYMNIVMWFVKVKKWKFKASNGHL